MRNKYKKRLIIIIVLFILAIGITIEMFKENNNLRNISEETKNNLMPILGISESNSFKPIYLKTKFGDPRDSASDGYEIKFEISKEDYEKNNMGYGDYTVYDALTDASKYEVKDDNTYICYLKVTPLYNKNKVEKLKYFFIKHEIPPVGNIKIEYEGQTIDITNIKDIDAIENILVSAKYNNEVCKGDYFTKIILNNDVYYIKEDCKEIQNGEKQAKISNEDLTTINEIIERYKNGNVENLVDKEKDESKEKLEEMKNQFNNGVDNLDTTIFLKDFENFKPVQNINTITESKAKEIAQKGFEESARRITQEGADNIESETIRIMEKYANNYFTAYYAEPSKEYENIKRKCYVFTRENEIGNGIMIYIDMQTGLIIGGGAFGD